MNDTARRIVSDRIRRGDRRDGRDYADYGDRRDYRGDMRGDRRGGDYRGEMEYDERRGVYGTDRYGVGGRDRGEDYGEDYRRDYGHEEDLKLSKSDMKHWKRMLKNSDGTSGEHFTMEQMREIAHQVGVKFEEYDEAEFTMTANMLYSDLGEALRPILTKDREAMIYAKLAKCWLEDEDGPEGSEKLALYFHCIVSDE